MPLSRMRSNYEFHAYSVIFQVDIYRYAGSLIEYEGYFAFLQSLISDMARQTPTINQIVNGFADKPKGKAAAVIVLETSHSEWYAPLYNYQTYLRGNRFRTNPVILAFSHRTYLINYDESTNWQNVELHCRIVHVLRHIAYFLHLPPLSSAGKNRYCSDFNATGPQAFHL
ncbi:hypothetical protein PILCRDRAFT_10749 [Piloderma croceum F 1598]|uniref:Uncharacterized protein n=1 Tax=Piloderma croceum (strain F 1598) TaxID=765440 RepID=A0A0C3FG56_PILCF|nr:hypothetical protein PILCRDRAFT_10749 [Piloderma croceum F 1598]